MLVAESSLVFERGAQRAPASFSAVAWYWLLVQRPVAVIVQYALPVSDID